jgi:RNA polymerase sigma-70 factor (ECF subfamily)
LRQPFDKPAAVSTYSESAEDNLGNQLVERLQRGIEPEDSARRLYEEFFPRVFGFFGRRGFPSDECGDLAQETFLKVFANLDGFRRESRFESWLFRIAQNVYKNHLRSRSTLKRDAQEIPWEDAEEVELSGDLPEVVRDVPAARGPLGEVLSEERAKLLRDAMEDLPTQMRRCVELRVQRDLKYREIAELMKISIDTVKAHLFQARRQLRDRLAEYFDGFDD